MKRKYTKRIKPVQQVEPVKRMPSLTDDHAAIIIDDAQNRLRENMVKLQTLEQPLKEAEELFKQAQQEFDTVKHAVERDEGLLEYMTRYKNNLDEKKPLRVLRAESHNDMKDREKKKLKGANRFNWTTWAEEVLNIADHFMTQDDLFDEIVRRRNLEPEFKATGKGTGYYKWTALKNCWKSNCEIAKRDRNSNSARLVKHKEKIGLVKWVDDNLNPLPAYRQQFQIAVAV